MKIKLNRRVVYLLVIILTVFSIVALPSEAMENILGEVVAIDSFDSTFQIKPIIEAENQEIPELKEFIINKDSVVYEGDAQVDSIDLERGDRVYIDYELDSDSKKLIAVMIHIKNDED